MQIEPSPDDFSVRYGRDEPQLVWTTLVADLETPVSAFLKIGGGRPLSFLLESVEGGATRGRYSIIGLDPDIVWRAQGERAEINRAVRGNPEEFVPCAGEAAAVVAQPARRKPHRRPRGAAADGGRRVRLSRPTTWCG